MNSIATRALDIAFFSTDRPSYRPEAALEGWQRIFAWFDTYLTQSEA